MGRILELVEKHSKRKRKYPKILHNKYRCEECQVTYYYKAIKCPVCSSKLNLVKLST